MKVLLKILVIISLGISFVQPTWGMNEDEELRTGSQKRKQDTQDNGSDVPAQKRQKKEEDEANSLDIIKNQANVVSCCLIPNEILLNIFYHTFNGLKTIDTIGSLRIVSKDFKNLMNDNPLWLSVIRGSIKKSFLEEPFDEKRPLTALYAWGLLKTIKKATALEAKGRYSQKLEEQINNEQINIYIHALNEGSPVSKSPLISYRLARIIKKIKKAGNTIGITMKQESAAISRAISAMGFVYTDLKNDNNFNYKKIAFLKLFFQIKPDERKNIDLAVENEISNIKTSDQNIALVENEISNIKTSLLNDHKKAADYSSEILYLIAEDDWRFLIKLPFWGISANRGNMKASFSLGLSYELGVGVPKDEKKAMEWYQLSASQGHATAQRKLGVGYEYGIGVEKDEKEAVKWYQLSAQQGDAAAQKLLGWCYEHSMGVEKNEKEAVKWWQLAANQGHEGAKAKLEELFPNTTQIEKSQENSTGF